MNKKPTIGITTYARNSENRFHLFASYGEAVLRAGGVPYLIPPLGMHGDYPFDGLILAGGGDIHPERYQGEMSDHVYDTDHDRDQTEFDLIHYAIEQQIPTLAICRGVQVLNVALGGDLYPHIPDAFPGRLVHVNEQRKPEIHEVDVDKNSKLAQILGVTHCKVSSQHHQALKKIGENLRVTAVAADGIIEAVELPEHPFMIGVQWHPEQTAKEDSIQQQLFDILIKACLTTDSN